MIPTLEQSHFWHPYTAIPAEGPRHEIVRAEGAFVWDESGRRLLDATSSWWCQIHGHCHPRLVGALSEQASRLDQVLVAPHTHRVVEDLSEKLCGALGGGFSKIFYSDNGSTSVEVAMKMALQYWQLKGETGRRKFLTLDRGYHGDTLGAISLVSPEDFSWAFGDWKAHSFRASSPYCYRCPLGKTFPGCQVQCIDSAREIFEKFGDQIAAVFVEPLVLGAGGLVAYPSLYLKELGALARNYGALLIYDEVFTGFGRTGPLFAFQALDPSSAPDIVCLSKGLTSGMLALGATAVRGPIFEAFVGGYDRRFSHGHTFTANALACRVALESLQMFEEERTLESSQPLVQVMRQNVERFLSAPHVGDVRHLGRIFALELVTNKETKATFTPANALGWKLATALWDKGVWIRPLQQVIYVIPPYCTRPEELTECLDKIEQVLYEQAEEMK